MKTVELFAGTQSFSKVMKEKGHEILSVELEPSFQCTLTKNIIDLHHAELPVTIDMLWASPPCQGFSVAVIGRNWNHDNTPKTDTARLGVTLVKKTLELISESNPRWWFIENPRGKLRKLPFMIEAIQRMGGVRHTVSYCQYGDTRMKPTDIWTNALWWTPKPICKNGDPCHESAPRGSRTGTQGIQGDTDRSRIPPMLFEEILNQYNDKIKTNENIAPSSTPQNG